MSRLTKSHPVARAMRSGMSMKQAWSAYRGGHAVRRNGGRRRRSRNPLIATLSNPFGGSIGAALGKIPVIGKPLASAASKQNLKSGLAVGAVLSGGFLAPTYLSGKGYIPAGFQSGWMSVAGTVGAGVVTALVVSKVMPGTLPVGLAAAVGGGVLQLMLTKGQAFLGLGDFLTESRGRLGQLPAGLIGDFMTVKKPFAALPQSGLGAGQRFSNVF